MGDQLPPAFFPVLPLLTLICILANVVVIHCARAASAVVFQALARVFETSAVAFVEQQALVGNHYCLTAMSMMAFSTFPHFNGAHAETSICGIDSTPNKQGPPCFEGATDIN